MIQKIKDKIEEKRLKSQVQRLFNPDQSELHDIQRVFLNTLKNERPIMYPKFYGHSLVFKYSIVTMVVVLCASSGLVALANKADVSASNPLYNLKRVGEKVQLAVSTEEKQVVLHEKFAQRRLNEIKQVQMAAAPQAIPTPTPEAAVALKNQIQVSSSKLEVASTSKPPEYNANKAFIDKLREDFKKELSKGIDQTIKTNREEVRNRKKELCQVYLESAQLQSDQNQVKTQLELNLESVCQSIAN